MTDLELLLPRANAPIAGNLPATREFYDFLRELIALAGEQSSDTESIEQLAARVLALEKAGGQSPKSIIGLSSVLVTDSATLAQIQLQGDVSSVPPWHYYGTDAIGSDRKFNAFPANLQGVAELDGEGYAFRLLDGTWGQRTFLEGDGITITDDGTSLTIALETETTLEFRVEDNILQFNLNGEGWIDILDLSDFSGGTPRVQIVPDTTGGTVTCDWSLYDDIRITLTTSPVTLTFSGAVDGQVCRLKLAQDASGGREATLPSEVRFNGTFPDYLPDETANFADLLQFRFDEADSAYDLFSLVTNIDLGGGAGLTEITAGITWSQSSAFAGLVADSTNMRDPNTDPSAGAATGGATNNAVFPEFIQADLGSAQMVSRITVGGGNLPSWGAVSTYLNGATIDYSADGMSWTAVATISGVTDSGTLDKDFDFSAVSAQYWRLARGGFLSTATFRLYG